jgi:hypothetical protein
LLVGSACGLLALVGVGTSVAAEAAVGLEPMVGGSVAGTADGSTVGVAVGTAARFVLVGGRVAWSATCVGALVLVGKAILVGAALSVAVAVIVGVCVVMAVGTTVSVGGMLVAVASAATCTAL